MSDVVQLAEIYKDIDAPADVIWSLLADFGHVDRIYPAEGVAGIPPVESIELTGEGIGSVRKVKLVGGAYGHERLEAMDENDRSFSYSMLAPPVFPVDDYYATVKVESKGPGRCRVTYGSLGRVQDIPLSELRPLLNALYMALIEGAEQLSRR